MRFQVALHVNRDLALVLEALNAWETGSLETAEGWEILATDRKGSSLRQARWRGKTQVWLQCYPVSDGTDIVAEWRDSGAHGLTGRILHSPHRTLRGYLQKLQHKLETLPHG